MNTARPYRAAPSDRRTRPRRGSVSVESFAVLAFGACAAVAGLGALGQAQERAIGAGAAGSGVTVRTANTPRMHPVVATQAAWGWLEPFVDAVRMTDRGLEARTALERAASDRHAATAHIAELAGTRRASELMPVGESETRFVTLNSASGAKKNVYRTASNRRRLAAVVRDSNADVTALQEVDHASRRSGRGNTALDTASYVDRRFKRFRVSPRGVRLRGRSAIYEHSADGAHVFRTDSGALVFGESTRARLKPAQIPSRNLIERARVRMERVLRRSRWTPSTAPYGNATLLGPRMKLLDAYVEALPAPGASAESIYGGMTLTDAARAARNRAVRAEYGAVEARSVLVTIAQAPDGSEHAFFNTHLSLTPEQRANQLERLVALTEHHRARGRNVVVLGDFNAQADELARVFEPAGLRHVAGVGIDQVWATNADRLVHGEDVLTQGASDHMVGATATFSP